MRKLISCVAAATLIVGAMTPAAAADEHKSVRQEYDAGSKLVKQSLCTNLKQWLARFEIKQVSKKNLDNLAKDSIYWDRNTVGDTFYVAEKCGLAKKESGLSSAPSGSSTSPLLLLVLGVLSVLGGGSQLKPGTLNHLLNLPR